MWSFVIEAFIALKAGGSRGGLSGLETLQDGHGIPAPPHPASLVAAPRAVIMRLANPIGVVARLAHRSLPDSESRRRRNHEPPKSGIPKRKKIAMHIGLLAKSITFSGQIMASDQLLPNSSRATKY